MKQIFSIALLSVSLFTSAQISLAGKANLIFPTGSPSWRNISNTASAAIENRGSNNVGFNVGLSLKANLPMAFFLMPELYYTSFKSQFTDSDSNTTFNIKNNRIDLPVLIGHKVLGDLVGVFIGPVASYNLSKEDTFNDFRENAGNSFTVGYQFGAQVEIKQLLINARYEGAFSRDQRNFINRVSGEEIRYDNRPNLFMIGVGYKF